MVLNCLPMLVFVTDAARPPDETLRVVEALAASPNVLVLFRDKRVAFDRALAHALAALVPLVVNVGDAERSSALAGALGVLGWHAPEAIWRAPGSLPEGLWSVADHDGEGADFARRRALPMVLVSPILIDKGRARRGWSALAGAVGGPLRVGLGGIQHAEHARQALAVGADGIAVQRALYETSDPRGRADELVEPFLVAPRREMVAALLRRALLGTSVSAPMSGYDEYLQATIEILQRHVAPEKTVKPTDHIQNDLGLDSLGVMEVVADIEDRFEVTIPSETLAALSTPEDVARVLGNLASSSA